MVVSICFYEFSSLIIFNVYLEMHSTPQLLELSVATSYIFIIISVNL